MRVFRIVVLLIIASACARTATTPPKRVPASTDTAAVLREIQADVRAIKTKSEKYWDSPELWIPILGTLLVAVVIQKLTAASQQKMADAAAGLAQKQADNAADRAATQLREQIEREEQRRKDDAARAERAQHHDRLFRSLEWFSGDTQKRSIGIGIVEANWNAAPALHETWTAVLVNQAVHLLTQSKERSSLVEFDNLVRILRILGWREAGEPPRRSNLAQHQRQRLQQAMRRAENQPLPEAGATGEARGLAIVPGTLQVWMAWLANAKAEERTG